MTIYDFHTLSPSDFEILACQLLRARHKLDFKSFGHGPDGGIDLFAKVDDRHEFIVQCKHYAGSSFADLKRAARTEKLKMDIRQPSRYLFVTSQDLTLSQQLVLVEELQPWISSVSEIIARRDLNDWLVEHPEVEQANFKLWMATATVLERIVQSGIWMRSEALLEGIQEKVQRFVSNAAYGRARKMLERKRICVVTGPPGIGKSMIADMLCLNYWHEGWHIIPLQSNEIAKCWDAWNSSKRQLFYFDDVFGQTDIQERLGRDNGPTIARLIDRVAASDIKRLVITSRSHVLREAQLRDESVERARLNARECIVQVSDYDQLQKARILYNHLYFSQLARETVRDFAQSRHYWSVIRHRNFRPRLIEQSILQHAVEEASRLTLTTRLNQVLDRPVMLWGPSFRESLNDLSRSILLQLGSFPVHGAELSLIKSAVAGSNKPIEFTSSLRRLEGSWIKISQSRVQSEPHIEFHDASCRDFILALYDSEPDCVLQVLRRAPTISSIIMILRYGLAREGRELKYPNIFRIIEGNRSEMRDLIRQCWTPPSKNEAAARVADLSRFLDAQDEYDLNLDIWGIERLLEIHVADPHSVEETPEAMDVLDRMRKTNGMPEDPTDNFVQLFRLAAISLPSIGPDAPWGDLQSIYRWVELRAPEGKTDKCYGSMYVGFLRWLNFELESVIENADNRDSAQDMAKNLQRIATSLFEPNLFTNDFFAFEVRLDDRFGEVDEYEYYDEDDYAGTPIRRGTEGMPQFFQVPRKIHAESPEEAINGLFGNLT